MKVTPSVAYPLPKIRVRDFEHVTTSSGHWFLLGEVVRELDLPVDSYLPGRELEFVYEFVDKEEGNDADLIESITRACTQWGVPYDSFGRDVSGRYSGVNSLPFLNSDLSLEARDQALVELGLQDEWKPTDDLEVMLERRRRRSRLVGLGDIGARWFAAYSIVKATESFITRQPLSEDLERDYNGFLGGFSRNVDFGSNPETQFSPTVFNVMALQLSNDILEQVPVRNCASESCGRPFTRQRGGRGRTDMPINRVGGVKYCSRTCADNQAHLMKARRDKAKATTTKRGTK